MLEQFRLSPVSPVPSETEADSRQLTVGREERSVRSQYPSDSGLPSYLMFLLHAAECGMKMDIGKSMNPEKPRPDQERSKPNSKRKQSRMTKPL
jgi:hypothetical protein